ncbi:50S ribosomal protein L24 [Candidatus Dependentiae bacterium]|nr:50S ribosomal protein L24 [Candidatus Dependentiae bacterium]
MMRIKKHDMVIVITGRDKGKRGQVLEVDVDKNLVKVSGVGIVTKHYKARRQGEASSIKKHESFIHISNVMLVSPTDSNACRVNFKVLEDGSKVRVCNRTKQTV